MDNTTVASVADEAEDRARDAVTDDGDGFETGLLGLLGLAGLAGLRRRDRNVDATYRSSAGSSSTR